MNLSQWRLEQQGCKRFVTPVTGGGPSRIASVQAVVEAGVAVMGHVGLLPQSISVLGGFRPQGQTAATALKVLKDAKVSTRRDLSRDQM